MKINMLVIVGLALLCGAFLYPTLLATVTYQKLVPTGNFYINGELATPRSTHTVSSPTLQLKFVATQHGEEITTVRVTKRNMVAPYDPVPVDLDETTPNTEWTGTLTLPSEGTFRISGYIYAPAFADEGGFMQTMSIIGIMSGGNGNLDGEDFTVTTLNALQILLGVAGVGLVVLGLRKKR